MAGEKAKILVVDDESHIVHVMSSKLQRAGYATLTASNGQEGLDLASEHLPDLIIVDNQMPVMDGVSMAQALCEQAGIASIPVLMVTGRGFAIPEQELTRTNVVAVLDKPFSPRDVIARVNELLREKPSLVRN